MSFELQDSWCILKAFSLNMGAWILEAWYIQPSVVGKISMSLSSGERCTKIFDKKYGSEF